VIDTINTIEVTQKPEITSDTVSALEKSLRDIGIKDAKAFSTTVYTLATNAELTNLGEIGNLVHHDVTQTTTTNAPLETKKDWDFAIKVDFKPGVTDKAARVLKDDLKLVGVKDAGVFTSKVHYIKGNLGDEEPTLLETFLEVSKLLEADTEERKRLLDIKKEKEKAARELKDMIERVASNPQIHDISILKSDEFKEQKGFEKKIHPVALGDRPNFFWVDMGSMDEGELEKTGSLGTLNTDLEINPKKKRGGTLALRMDYMHAFQEYVNSELNTQVVNSDGTQREKGVVTDTEIELIAQMWSEHCRHSLYNAKILNQDGTLFSKEGIFDRYIKRPTLEVLKDKPHLGVSIYKDNAGVFEFDSKHLLFVKNETHNSPSALDPFGGAITGIVGVNRDPAGTGLGGEVIANFLGYFLGHPEDKKRYFKSRLVKKIDPKTGEEKWVSEQTKVPPEEIEGEWNLDELLLNPGQIFDGVVRGVEEGGNQMGIGINLGTAQFHNRYNGKPMVIVGSVGKAPIKIKDLKTHEKHIDIEDRLIIAGGRAGRDGIHGATFSSEGLTDKSPATAVQIGDPYTQKKLFEALLEARDKKYIKFITDLGAGGVSCAALEMANETGGLEIDIDKLLIKYPGMTATEIFMNESQERMAIAVDPKHVEEVKAIFEKHEVEYSDIGRFTDSGRAIVYAKEEKVVDMNMKFIHEGYPERSLEPTNYKLKRDETFTLQDDFQTSKLKKLEAADGNENVMHKNEFYEMLRRPNFSSVAPFMDKMDRDVKSLQMQHCIQGKGRVSTKASCTFVDHDSNAGLIQSYGHAERQVYIDAELSGKNSFLRSIGNNIALGGRLDYMVATDQALWQSSNDGKYQKMLIEANKGMAEVITGCKIPVISGKDSMYNQAKVYDDKGNIVERGVFPTIFMTTFAKIDEVTDIVTVSAKTQGDLVYVVGSKTKADMGGSEYMNMHSEQTGEEFNIGQVSDENMADVFDTFRRMNKAKDVGMIQSAKYVESGGIAMAVKDTSTAGEHGIEFDMSKLDKEDGIQLYEAMYGETEGRFLVTIKPGEQKAFESLFEGKFSKVGEVKGTTYQMKHEGETILDEGVGKILSIYHKIEPVEKAA